MTNLSKEICRRLADARREKGLSQSEVAAAIGCKQSALSMFEAGNPTKLSEETVVKLAAKFGISLEPPKEEVPAAVAPILSAPVVRGYCPNCHCPSNVPYAVDGWLFFRPSRAEASPAGGARCAVCGEVLEKRCPVCGAPLNDGACCATCGSPYVANTLPEGTDAAAYARVRREEIAALRALA